jgi:hypothetical protein
MQVGKCYCSSFQVKGQEFNYGLQAISIFESICKPYITAHAIIIDPTNFLNNNQLVGGETVTVTLNSGMSTYTQTFQILQIHSRRLSSNMRSEYYEMALIGQEYFADKQNHVQTSFQNTTVTQAIQNVHNKYMPTPLNVPLASSGLLGQNNNYAINTLRPFTTVSNLLRLASFASYPSGNVLYFRDAKQANLVPLEYLIKNISSTQTFIQKNTWGASYSDIMNATNAILAVAYGDGQNKEGSGGVLDARHIASTINQGRFVFDIIPNQPAVNQPARNLTAGSALGTPVGSLFGSIFQAIAGGVGGQQNYTIYDSTKMPVANARQMDQEKFFAAQMKGGPSVTIKVPCQSGFNLTVGQGYNATLMAPLTGSSNYQQDPRGGQFLAADVIHEINLSAGAAFNGMTTIRGIKGGLGS